MSGGGRECSCGRGAKTRAGGGKVQVGDWGQCGDGGVGGVGKFFESQDYNGGRHASTQSKHLGAAVNLDPRLQKIPTLGPKRLSYLDETRTTGHLPYASQATFHTHHRPPSIRLTRHLPYASHATFRVRVVGSSFAGSPFNNGCH